MLKSEKGKVTISGKKEFVKSELTCLLLGIYEEKVLTKEDLEECLQDACKGEKELRRELQQRRIKQDKEIDNLMNELFNTLFDD